MRGATRSPTDPRSSRTRRNTAAEQALQAGMHHDGMHFFPLATARRARLSSEHGLLVMNHEYTDDGLLHAGRHADVDARRRCARRRPRTACRSIEVRLTGGRWTRRAPVELRAPHHRARRRSRMSGPAAGHAALQTARRPVRARSCSARSTTARTATRRGARTSRARRTSTATSSTARATMPRGCSGATASTPRAAATAGTSSTSASTPRRHPNEPNRFGWVVEIDPFDPQSQPVKRTALGRFKHEGAAVTLATDGRVVVYMGDDERFEYIYKFVCARPRTRPATARRTATCSTTARSTSRRFDADGGGEWLPLVHGQGGSTPRTASRPGRRADPRARRGRCGRRDEDGRPGVDRRASRHQRGLLHAHQQQPARRQGRGPAIDAANPRADNVFGHIIRWREDGGDPAARAFEWDIFALCGDPDAAPMRRSAATSRATPSAARTGCGSTRAACCGSRPTSRPARSTRATTPTLGNNMMLAADVATGEIAALPHRARAAAR